MDQLNELVKVSIKTRVKRIISLFSSIFDGMVAKHVKVILHLLREVERGEIIFNSLIGISIQVIFKNWNLFFLHGLLYFGKGAFLFYYYLCILSISHYSLY